MLTERPNVTQHPGEPHRRFFYDESFQLYVWTDARGQLVAFELAYDLWSRPRAFRWSVREGVTHYRVDDGEDRAFRKSVAVLREDAASWDPGVARGFAQRSHQLDTSTASKIQDALDQFIARGT